MSFNNQYRPTSLNTVVGNGTVLNQIQTLLKGKAFPKASMFYGNSGCGKTTLSRIVAKNLVCEQKTSVACGTCQTCQTITQTLIENGSPVEEFGVFEIDVNRDGKKDIVLDYIEDMKTPPFDSISGKKVYIWHEFQTMSYKAQSALLQLTEEPPEWLYVIITTTAPEQLIQPLRDRLFSFKIVKPRAEELARRLNDIATEEKLKVDAEVIKRILSETEGNPRKSVAYLESLVNFIRTDTPTAKRITHELLVSFTGGNVQTKLTYPYTYLNKLVGDRHEQTDVFSVFLYLDTILAELTETEFFTALQDFVLQGFYHLCGSTTTLFAQPNEKEMQDAVQLFETFGLEKTIELLKTIETVIQTYGHKPTRFALTMLTLHIGFPEQLEPLETDDIKTLLDQENRESLDNFIENKTEVKLASRKEPDKKTSTKSGGLKSIQDLFPDSFVVEE